MDCFFGVCSPADHNLPEFSSVEATHIVKQLFQGLLYNKACCSLVIVLPKTKGREATYCLTFEVSLEHTVHCKEWKNHTSRSEVSVSKKGPLFLVLWEWE